MSESRTPKEPNQDARSELHDLRDYIRTQAALRGISSDMGEVVFSGGSWQFLRRPSYTHVDFHSTESVFIDDDETNQQRDLERRHSLARRANDDLTKMLNEREAEIADTLEYLNKEWDEELERRKIENSQELYLQRTVGPNELLGYKGEGPRVVVDKLLCKGWIGLLAGASKSYKSWLSLQLALSVSNGWNWLGFASKAGKVLYVDHELSQHSLQNRLSKMYKAYGMDNPDATPVHGPEFLIMRAATSQKHESQINLILRVLQETHGRFHGRYDLIILDPLYMFLEGKDENSATQMVEVFDSIRDLQRKTGAAILINAHFRKGVRDSRSASTTDHISGSGVFTRYPDVVLTLSRVADGQPKKLQEGLKNVFTLDFTVRHLRAPADKRLFFNESKHLFEIPDRKQQGSEDVTIASRKQARGRSRKSDPKIASYLKRNKSEIDGKPLSDIVKIVVKETGVSQSTVYRFFKNKNGFTYEIDNQQVVNLSRFAKLRNIKL